MKKSIYYFLTLYSILVFLVSLVDSVHAQSKKTYDSVALYVQKSFNLNEPEKIYMLTSAAFRSKMTESQFAAGMSKFHAKMGDWTSHVFEQENEKGWDYMAFFENSRQLFSVKLDETGKISRLNFAAAPLVIADKTFSVSSNNPLNDTVDRWLEGMVRPYIQKGTTSGIVIAIIDGDKVRRYAYGSINKATQQLPDPERSIFEIGSVTKTFNALLLAQQVVAGKLKLSDPVNLYLPDSIPEISFAGRQVTLQDLANHTSGFPRLPANIFNGRVNPKDPYKHYVADSLYSFLKQYKISVAPGTVFSYSNYGAGLLSTILERKLSDSFDNLMVKNIARPLRMRRTKALLAKEDLSWFAQGYNESGVATEPWDLASLKGSGAIRSTLNDMVKYIRFQMNPSGALKEAIRLSHQQTFAGKDQSMGLGWRINKIGDHTYFHHSGGTGGFRSFAGFDPGRKIGIVILSNAAQDVTSIGESYLKLP